MEPQDGLPAPPRPNRWQATLLRAFGDPLTWPSAHKAAGLVAVGMPLVIGYVGQATYVLAHPDAAPYLVRPVLAQLRIVLLAYVVLGAILLALHRPIAERSAESVAYVRACLYLWFGIAGWSTYLTGTFSSISILTVLGGAMVAYFLFDTRLATEAVGGGMLILGVTHVLERLRILPYGPLVNEKLVTDGRPADDWVWINLGFTFAIFVVSLTVLSFGMTLWRQRSAEVRYFASVDALTGLANRRHFMERLDVELARASRHGKGFAFVLLDVDLFKRVNDTHGHQVGDRALVRIADELVTRALRRIDLAGRYGGEELAILLPETDVEGALLVAERCRALIEALRAPLDRGGELAVTASFGCAAYPRPDVRTVDDLIRCADRALYQAKETGRNRVVADRPP